MTDPNEFKRFHLLLKNDRPDYEPHYIRVKAGDAVDEDGEPAGKQASGTHTKITPKAAIRRLKRGENVGIEAHKDDDLVIIDIDDPEVVPSSELKPTLTVMSRSRNGYHHFYFATDPTDKRVTDNTNIKGVGEIRSDNYYVLAPGSWVDTSDIADKIPEGEIENAGKYTIHSEKPVAGITFDEIPQVFKDKIEGKAASNREGEQIKTERAARKAARHATAEGEGSRLFKLELADVVRIPTTNTGERFVNPLHPGGKGKTAAISDKGYLQCYSHSVTHTALSALAVLAEVADCESAGQGHGNSTVGASCVDYTDGGTLGKMWSYAMREGMIPPNDPIPWDALRWYAINQGVIKESDVIDGYKMPPGAVTQTKGIIKSKEGIEIINIGTYPKPEPKPKTAQPETPGNVEDYFIGRDFIAKPLADTIMSRHHFKTMKEGREIFVYDGGIYIGKAETIIEVEAHAALNDKSTTHRVNEVVGYIQRSTYTDHEDFNKDKRIINLKNGLYDTRTGELKPHTPDFLSTVRIPIKYDPDGECPVVDKFLSDVLDESDIRVALEWFGYLLEPHYWIQKMLMLLGEGGNGKSKFLGLMSAFIGKKNIANESIQNLSNNRFRVANLYGKLANIHADISSKVLQDTGILKLLSGGDDVSVEKKNKASFEFENFARLIFSANRLPRTADDTDAWYRRWTFINFTRKFGDDADAVKKADKQILGKLTVDSELSGLLNRALASLKGLHDRDGFGNNMSTDETRRIYTRLSDPVTTFLEDCCIVTPKESVAKSVLFGTYIEYCKDNNQSPIGQVAFTKRIRDMGKFSDCQVGGKAKQERGWRGVNIDGSIFSTSCNTLGNTLRGVPKPIPSEPGNTGNTPFLPSPTLLEKEGIDSRGIGAVITGEAAKRVLPVLPTPPDSDLGCTPSVLPSVLSDGTNIYQLITSHVQKYGKAPEKVLDEVFNVFSAKLEDQGYDPELVKYCIFRFRQGHRIFIPEGKA